MRIYITDSQIPELAALPPDLARAIGRRAMGRMRSEAKFVSWLPSLLVAVGCVLGAYAGVWLGCSLGIGVMPMGPGETSFLYIPGMGLGGWLAGLIGKQIQVQRLRPYIRRTIDDCVSAISKRA